MQKEKFHWHKQKVAEDCQIIDTPAYDTRKDFCADPSGYYVLIRPNFDTYRLELAMVNSNHEIEAVFIGRSQQDICRSIVKSSEKFITDAMHWAYIGRELKKAEIALAMGNSAYFQE